MAMLAGSIYWNADRQKRKEFEGVVAGKKSQEKREAWLKELERRDVEDREVKERLNARIERSMAREAKAAADAKPEEGVLRKAEEQAKKAFGKGGDGSAQSALERNESQGVIMAAVRDLLQR